MKAKSGKQLKIKCLLTQIQKKISKQMKIKRKTVKKTVSKVWISDISSKSEFP